MLKFITGLNPYVIAGAVVLIAAAWWHGYMTGKYAMQNANIRETVKTIEKVRYVRQKTDAMPSGAVYDGLLKWTR